MLTYGRSGNKELIDSGSIIVDDNIFDIGITIENSNQIITRIKFVESPARSENIWVYDIVNGRQEIDLVNASKSGSSGAIPYADNGNNQIYIILSWIDLGGILRQISYSLYRVSN